jgi:hypothetical protein
MSLEHLVSPEGTSGTIEGRTVIRFVESAEKLAQACGHDRWFA